MPAAQEVQFELDVTASAVEKLPAAQLTHTEREASGPYVPGAQEGQIEAPVREYVPMEQVVHTELDAAENVPAEQEVQVVAPAT